MRLTRYTDYSLRVLMHLATHAPRVCSVAEIARAHGASEHHLMKVVQDLAREGLVETVRGRRGGVRLARSPEDIGVGEVVRWAEGACALVDCTGCPLLPGCRLTGLLAEAQAAFYAVLDRCTIGELTAKPPLKAAG